MTQNDPERPGMLRKLRQTSQAAFAASTLKLFKLVVVALAPNLPNPNPPNPDDADTENGLPLETRHVTHIIQAAVLGFRSNITYPRWNCKASL